MELDGQRGRPRGGADAAARGRPRGPAPAPAPRSPRRCEQDIRTRAYIFNVILQEKAIDDRLRHFPTLDLVAQPRQRDLGRGGAGAGRRGHRPLRRSCVRYYRVKKRLLGRRRAARVGPLRAGRRARRATSPGSEAKELVLGSYQRFSPKVGQAGRGVLRARAGSTRRWCRARRGGAYCMPVTPRHHPYVMLNFTGKLRDALVHGARARPRPARPACLEAEHLRLPPAADPGRDRIGVRRGADLRPDHGRGEGPQDPARRLLCNQVEDAFSTVFRQVAFNRFEDACHTARRKRGRAVARRSSARSTRPSSSRCSATRLILTDEHKVWWSYVGHFLLTPGLRLRLRVRQPARAVRLPPLPRARAVVRRRLPRLPGGRRLDPAGRAGEARRAWTSPTRRSGTRGSTSSTGWSTEVERLAGTKA